MRQQPFQSIEPGKTTIGELVAENYHAAGVFREYGMDFCCGGGVTISRACEQNQVDADELIERLKNIPWNQSSGEQNYKAWQPDYLIRHIEETHHRFVRVKCDEIGVYADKVARVYGERNPENRRILELFRKLQSGMLQHLEDEENRVFPMIEQIYRDRMSGSTPDPERIKALKEELDHMEEDHEEAGALMAQIREASNGFTPPDYACTTYRILYQNLAAFEEDLHLHVHLENNILFKKAKQIVQVEPDGGAGK